MPRFKFILKVLLCLSLLSSFASAQSRAIKLDQAPTDKCRISKSQTFYSADGTRFTTTYEVDNQSWLVKEFNAFKHKDASQDFKTVMTNTYDAQGFLTRRLTINTSGDTNEYTEKSTTEKFTYADGRLWKIEVSQIYKDASRNTNNKTENKYDESGNLSERIFTSNGDGEAVRHMFSNGKLTGISDPKNTYIINDKGYVTKKTDSEGGYTVYNYSAKDQPLNQVTYSEKGEKAHEDSHEFSTTLHKAPTNPVSFKGHPSIPAMYGDYSFLESRYKVSYLKTPSTDPSTYETVYTHEVDRNGNLTKRRSMSGSGKAAYEETVEHTYVDCK